MSFSGPTVSFNGWLGPLLIWTCWLGSAQWCDRAVVSALQAATSAGPGLLLQQQQRQGQCQATQARDVHSTSSGSLCDVMSPTLQLQGLWHPLLAVTGNSIVAGSGSKIVKANDVLLGGGRPGTMLLTGS